MPPKPLRIGLVGAGYIASWHADAIVGTPDVQLTAVCDPAVGSAQSLAATYSARVFTNLDDLIAAEICDAVHILTPPDLHRDLAVTCLEAGLHVLAEKPVALSSAQMKDIAAAAKRSGMRFHAGHNFLGLPSYQHLKRQIAHGTVGRISSAEVHWCFPFSPLRSGPYSIWPLRTPQNLLLELGPHVMAFIVDLFGAPTIEHVVSSKPISLPDGEERAQSWRISARARDVDIQLSISLVETVDDRALTVRGSSGRARLDLAADTLVIDAENPSDLIMNPLRRQLSMGGQHLRSGIANATKQLFSLNRKSPYALSFQGMLAGVYGPLKDNREPDPRFSADHALSVMKALDDVVARTTFKPFSPPVATRKPNPTAMVIGGTGFIGRALTRGLVAQGQDVRVISRGRNGPFQDLPDQVETVSLSLKDSEGLAEAMRGIDTVYNLARSIDTTWEDCLKNDVAVAEGIAGAALQANVKRLVYTGTIASYDMSDPQKVITEETGFPKDMSKRNLYARSKAECERRLLVLYQDRGLPLVIARPGIVVGKGGPLQHWGIGRWHGAGAVRIWGNGRNILPFVLIDDTVDALIRMGQTAGIEGEDYNIIGAPMMTSIDYFDAIETELGACLEVASGNLLLMYGVDATKALLKTVLLRQKNVARPSLMDWRSRAHLSRFDNRKARTDLEWEVELDHSNFVRKAIGEANLFGF